MYSLAHQPTIPIVMEAPFKIVRSKRVCRFKQINFNSIQTHFISPPDTFVDECFTYSLALVLRADNKITEISDSISAPHTTIAHQTTHLVSNTNTDSRIAE